MTADLLSNRARLNFFNQATPQKQRRLCLIAADIIGEPVLLAPRMRRSDDFRMPLAIRCLAAFQKKMADRAPGRADIELGKQAEQAINDDLALKLAGVAKPRRPEEVERSPQQFEVEADRKDAAFQLSHGPDCLCCPLIHFWRTA